MQVFLIVFIFSSSLVVVVLFFFCRASAGGSALSGLCGRLSVGRSLKKLTPRQLGDEDEIDEDVGAEADRVARGGADNDVVKVGQAWLFVYIVAMYLVSIRTVAASSGLVCYVVAVAMALPACVMAELILSAAPLCCAPASTFAVCGFHLPRGISALLFLSLRPPPPPPRFPVCFSIYEVLAFFRDFSFFVCTKGQPSTKP